MDTRSPPTAAFVLLVATAVHASAARTIWVEAEQFENAGGWTTDAQFIDQMGSPYLLAAGIGKPVEDAVTTVRPPVTGRLQAPRRFRIDNAPGWKYTARRLYKDGVCGICGSSGTWSTTWRVTHAYTSY